MNGMDGIGRDDGSGPHGGGSGETEKRARNRNNQMSIHYC